MIYRIAIYSVTDGKRKFDHYASDEESEYLRVNKNGKVLEMVYPRDTKSWDWQNASDTHEVEWGFEKDGKEYYVGDILESPSYEEIYYDSKFQCFAISIIWQEPRGQYGEPEVMHDKSNIYDVMPNVIGNIHEESK